MNLKPFRNSSRIGRTRRRMLAQPLRIAEDAQQHYVHDFFCLGLEIGQAPEKKLVNMAP